MPPLVHGSYGIPSVYRDLSEDCFQREMARVVSETAIERDWIGNEQATPYSSNRDILADVETGKLERVGRGLGFMTIGRLAKWTPEQGQIGHEEHYSPPFLAGHALRVLKRIGQLWSAELGEGRFMPVTSLVRSMEYQRFLAQQPRKVTVTDPSQTSSHTVGWAFDIDGCGLYETQDNGLTRAINPRTHGYNSKLATESHLVIKSVLDELLRHGVPLNAVEELPGTQENCFHVCVRPVDGE